jgi:CLIP-associating protein 1/2
MDAIERRVPKLAVVLQPLLQKPPASSPLPTARTSPRTIPSAIPHPTSSDSLEDDEDWFEDQNDVDGLNRSYETLQIQPSPSVSGKGVRVQGFGERVVEALEGLRADDTRTVVQSLQTIANVVDIDCEKFKPYLPLVASQMCSAMDDVNEVIAAYAFGALRAVFMHPELGAFDAFTTLASLINGQGNSVAPLCCADMVTNRATKEELEHALPIILPGVIKACTHRTAAIRQRAFSVLGSSQRVMGLAWMSPHIESLPAVPRAVLSHYAA